MATLSERLQFLITADGAQAIAAFQKVGEAAEKELGKAESKLDKAAGKLTKLGGGATASALVVGTGLAKVAMGASDLNESLSKASVIFGDATEGIVAFGDKAAKSIGQSKVAAIDAASTFGVFGKAAGLTGTDLAKFSTDLVRLSSDLASFGNSTPEEAVEALGQALRGENEGMRRYGVLLDDATLKNRALSMGLISTTTGTLPPAIKVQAAYAEILAQTTDAQGDFAKTSDGAANQQRILKAELKNLSDSIGSGVLPMFTALVSTASSAVGKFNELDPATRGAIGSVLAFATAGTGAVGVLSSIAGQVLKVRQRFTDASGAISKAGLAVGAIGVTVGIAAAAFALMQTNVDRTIISMDDFGKAADVSIIKSLRDVKVAFDEATIAQQKNLEEYESGNALKAWSDAVDVHQRLAEATENVEQVNKDFNRTLKESPEYAQRFIDAAKAAGYETSEWQAQLDETIRRQADAKNATEEFAAKVDKAAESTNKYGMQLGQGTTEADRYVKMISAKGQAVLDAAKADEEAAEKAKEAAKAKEELAKQTRDAFAAAEESIDPALRYRNAQREVRDAAREVAEKLKIATDKKFEDAEANDDVQAAQDNLMGSLKDTAREYANTSGAAEGTREWAQKYVDKLNELRPQYGEALGPAIAEYDELTRKLSLLISQAQTFAKMNGTGRGAAGYEDNYGGVRATGGPVSTNTAYLVGERGPELFVPNGNGQIIPNDALGGGSPMGAGTGSTYNITVNALSPQAAGRAVVEAIAAYERTHGKGWRL